MIPRFSAIFGRTCCFASKGMLQCARGPFPNSPEAGSSSSPGEARLRVGLPPHGPAAEHADPSFPRGIPLKVLRGMTKLWHDARRIVQASAGVQAWGCGVQGSIQIATAPTGYLAEGRRAPELGVQAARTGLLLKSCGTTSENEKQAPEEPGLGSRVVLKESCAL